jgi:serine/threonine-protein kinase RsbW
MRISEKLPSRLDIISIFVTALMDKLKKSGLNKDELFDVKLCLEEALINAMKHGNKFDPKLEVEVELEAKDGILSIEVRDQGEGFDFTKIPNPTEKDNLHKNSGRGVFLIKKLMDDVRHFDCGRKIKMVKFLNTGGQN